MAGTWPLTGRAEELRFIHTATSRPDGARGIVLAGAAGVGKTRLAREAVNAATRNGMTGRWAVATGSARTLPLGAFAPLLTGIEDHVHPSPLVAASRALLADVAVRGAVVGVDDAHLLDELSALLVHQLVLQRSATVVLTVRTGEPAPDAITALWKDGHLERLELQPLSAAETAALLDAVLDGPVDTGAAERMWALTRGNALYLRHLVDGEVDSGRLRRVRGVWSWPDPPALTPGLSELVESRFGQLPEPVGEVLDLLALGEPLRLTTLNRMCEAAALEQAESRDLISVEQGEQGPQVRLAHPLYGEVRRARLGQLRARRLRGQLAAALADENRPDTVLRRAVLAVDADSPADPELLTAAAGKAVGLLDLPLAQRLARAAIDVGAGFPAQLALAYALTWQSHGEQAEQLLAEMTAATTDDRQRARATIARCGNLFWSLRQPDRAEAVLDAALASTTVADARVPLIAMRAAFHAFLGRHDEAIRCGRQANAGGDAPAQAVLLAAYGLVTALGVRGHADQIPPIVDRAYTASGESFDAAKLGYGIGDLHLTVLRLAGYHHEAARVAAQQHARLAQTPGPLRILGTALLGYAALGAGQLDAAIRYLREVDAATGTADTTGVHTNCLLRLTQAQAMTGDAAAARATLAALTAHRHPAFVFLRPEILLAQAWVAAAEGAVSEAIRLARDAATAAADADQPAHEVFALHTATCFGDVTTADRLAELAGRVDGPRAPAAAAQASALAAGDAAGLHAAAQNLERMGDLLAAADAAAQAAAAHARHDHRSAQAAAAAHAQELAARCGGARTPALAALARPLPLTAREREIVTLAAGGLTNRQIATRLVVSVRTVEGHLYRAAAKLGTSDRTHFSALLHDNQHPA